MWKTAVLLALLTAQPALSLSCMKPDVAQDYRVAAEAQEAYVVAHGTLSFAKGAAPAKGAGQFQARLQGKALGAKGFDIAFDRRVTVRVTCAGPWCGKVTPGEYLMFMKQTTGGYEVLAGPCGALLHPKPNAAQLATVTACHAGRCPRRK